MFMDYSNSTQLYARVMVRRNCLTPDNSTYTCVIVKTQSVSMSSSLTLLSVGVLGHMLSLIVLYKTKSEKHRTVFYTLLCALIWTDLWGQVLTGIPPLLVYSLSLYNSTTGEQQITWQGGQITCQLHGFVMIVVGCMTPSMVTFMSVERIICLKMWHFYARCMTRCRARTVIMIILIMSMLFASLPFLGVGRFALQFPGSWCFLNFHAESVQESLYASLFSILVLLMIVIIVVSNVVVIWTLLSIRRYRKIKFQKQSLSNSATSSTVTGHCSCSKLIQQFWDTKNSKSVEMTPKSSLRHLESEMVVLLCFITVSFAVCWSPLMIQILINTSTKVKNYKRDLSFVHLLSINQVLDPWIYILLRKSFFLRLKNFCRSYFTCQLRLPRSFSAMFTCFCYCCEDINKESLKTVASSRFRKVTTNNHRRHFIMTQLPVVAAASQPPYVNCEVQNCACSCHKEASEDKLGFNYGESEKRVRFWFGENHGEHDDANESYHDSFNNSA